MKNRLSKVRRWLLGLLSVIVLALGVLIAAFYHADVPQAEVDARYTDQASQFLELLGSRVHFKDEGSADLPALLLIHGTSSSLHTWDGWCQELQDRYRILRLDLPGYGLTGANHAGPNGAGDYTVEYRLRVLDALLDARGVGSLAVAGNSLGGLVAWRYALARPDRVEALVLVDPAGAPRTASSESGGESGGFRVIDLAHMPVVRHLLTRLTPKFLVRNAFHQVYGDPSKVTDELIDRHYLMLLRAGNRQAMIDAAAQRTLEPSSAALLGKIHQPVLLEWGAADTWIPVSDAALFDTALPNSEVIVYEGAGHVPMEEIPERTARDAANFLDRHLTPVRDLAVVRQDEVQEPLEDAASARDELGS